MRKARHIPQLGEENECKFAKVVNTNVGVDKYGQTLIGCRCKCGNYFTATIARWNRSKGLSCGCMLRQWHRGSKPIPLGRLGHLTVIESGIVKPTGKHVARCICDCNPNKVIEIAECDLRKNTRSCGCYGRVANGAVFGRLTVLNNSLTSPEGHSLALVRCSCPAHKEFVVEQHYLKRGNVKSCGCLHYDSVTVHGESRTRLYLIWKGMKDRCHNPRSEYSKWYLKKGITLCPEWEEYIPFRNWARANGYDDSLTIDRIDYNKGYSPNNCRWADRKMQSNNKSDNVVLEYKGENHNLTEWAERLSIPVSRIRSRYRAGWTIEEMLTYGGKKTRGWRGRENIGI